MTQTHAPFTLSQCRPGQKCKIVKVHGKGQVFRRLLEMGLIQGTSVKVIRYAPFGDPIEIELHGYHLSLRKTEASMVEIEHA